MNTAIIIINWNGWETTIDCLNSFEFPLQNAHIFIVDNASEDDSIQQLAHYCTNRSIPYLSTNPGLLKNKFDFQNQITIVANDHNAGFAGGNNVILRFLLTSPSHFKYAWLLNNDTTIRPTTLPALQEKFITNPSIAFCGSVLLDYYQPQLVQCCGVNHYKYLGVSKLYLKDEEWEKIKDTPVVTDAHQDYQNGASLMVHVDKLAQIGIMDETFFLYSEEADWQFRAAKAGFPSLLAEKSVVYHKGSVSTVNTKYLFFYHYNRSSIIMTRKNFGLLAAISSTFALFIITLVRASMNAKSVRFGCLGIIRGWKTHTH